MRQIKSDIKQSTSNLSTREERYQEREKQEETVNTVRSIVNSDSSNYVILKKLNEIV
tara:strand:+ start:461 stop:631 length:171 start_codon:yes stop_codon:yes gene_type:complete